MSAQNEFMTEEEWLEMQVEDELNWQLLTFDVEYWVGDQYGRDFVEMYSDDVDINDPTEIIDRAVTELFLQDSECVLRTSYFDTTVTLWYTPVEGGSSNTYAID